MSEVRQLIYLILPLILAGILNMVFVNLPVLNQLKKPMDQGKLYKDGKRIFGDNKTWKGFWGMMVLTALCMLLFEVLAKNFEGANELSLIDFRAFEFPIHSLLYGGLWGLAYVLAELPNSFIKRRIDIQPGTNAQGWTGWVFTLVDQSDSVLGCLLVTPVFYPIRLIDAAVIIFLATGLHLLFNFLLYLAGLKKQPR